MSYFNTVMLYNFITVCLYNWITLCITFCLSNFITVWYQNALLSVFFICITVWLTKGAFKIKNRLNLGHCPNREGGGLTNHQYVPTLILIFDSLKNEPNILKHLINEIFIVTWPPPPTPHTLHINYTWRHKADCTTNKLSISTLYSKVA